jgi:hypothetical protein
MSLLTPEVEDFTRRAVTAAVLIATLALIATGLITATALAAYLAWAVTGSLLAATLLFVGIAGAAGYHSRNYLTPTM